MPLREEVKKGAGTKYLNLKNDREFSPEIWYTSFPHEYKVPRQKSAKSERMGDMACLISCGMTLNQMSSAENFQFEKFKSQHTTTQKCKHFICKQ